MYLENLVVDAVEPQRLGRFWEEALGCERLTDEQDIVETRLTVEGGPVLDLCFPAVADPSGEPARLRPVLLGGDGVVERLLGSGAREVGPALADPEGNPFGVVEERAAYAGSGPLAAFRLESADPDRDVRFWAWLTGWEDAGLGGAALRHPSSRGPLLELRPEQAPKGAGKNRMHLDVRLETGEDADEVAAAIAARGGREYHPDWGALPWRLYLDPSGNEFCVLPAYR